MTKKKDKAQTGRPTHFSAALGAKICQRVALGESMREICADKSMPNRDTVLDWQHKRDDFREELAKARENRADARADRIDAYLAELKAGKLDPQSCRVLVDGEKWLASKEKPSRYADKVDVTSDSKALLLPATDEAMLIATARWVANLLTRATMPQAAPVALLAAADKSET